MGRELVAEACNVAMCDVSPTGLAETQRLCEAAGLPQGLGVPGIARSGQSCDAPTLSHATPAPARSHQGNRRAPSVAHSWANCRTDPRDLSAPNVASLFGGNIGATPHGANLRYFMLCGVTSEWAKNKGPCRF